MGDFDLELSIDSEVARATLPGYANTRLGLPAVGRPKWPSGGRDTSLLSGNFIKEKTWGPEGMFQQPLNDWRTAAGKRTNK